MRQSGAIVFFFPRVRCFKLGRSLSAFVVSEGNVAVSTSRTARCVLLFLVGPVLGPRSSSSGRGRMTTTKKDNKVWHEKL
jgi:hypothetical protein